MKAFLLAAGFGTRLKPITNDIPKCLAPINGKPLLYNWLDILEKEKIDEVLINSHYLSEKVEEAIEKRENKIKIHHIFEEYLLGTAGTILSNRDFVKDEDNFYILYGDNLTNVSLSKLYDFHKSVNSIYTTYVYETNVPEEKGIFLADEDTGKVLDFEEKPKHPKSNLANAGIGILNKQIFDYFDNNNQDFGREILPKLTNKMYVLRSENYIQDIGTLNDYYKAQKDWLKISI